MSPQDKANGWQTEAEVRADLYVRDLDLKGIRAFDRAEGFTVGYETCQKAAALPLALLIDALREQNYAEVEQRAIELRRELTKY